MALGFKLRTGGGLDDKVFGAFSLSHEEDAEETQEEQGTPTDSADFKAAKSWAKKQTEQARLLGKDFTFSAHIPATTEEYDRLYTQYLTKRDFALYR